MFRFGREHGKIFAVDETGMQAFLFIAYEQFEDRILVSIGFDTSEMGGSMAEVLAYGTALVVEPDSAPPQPVSLHCDVSLFSIKCEKYSSHFRKVSTTN